MCGIIGILGAEPAAPRIMEALRRLEYRGYDSAGVATVDDGALHRSRAPGKLSALAEKLSHAPLSGRAGIGHTRWATHGGPTEENAHPQASARVALVHNGIIENFAALKADLASDGYDFESATDTETIVGLITRSLESGAAAPREAFADAVSKLRGAYAIAAVFAGEDDLLLVACQGSPLAIGLGEGENFIGSDAFALAPFTRRVIYLRDGDRAVISRSAIEIFDAQGAPAVREETLSSVADGLVDKDGHRHFMAKEIHEQPEVVAHTLAAYVDPATSRLRDAALAFDFSSLDRLTISACGTAYYAGLVAKYWFERWAKLPCDVDIASELRYRDPPYGANGGALFISQSGETADTLAALRAAGEAEQRTGALVNVVESSIARAAGAVFTIAAGPEIGVASTKAFTCQLTALACLALAAARQRGALDDAQEGEAIEGLLAAPRLIAEALKLGESIEEIAQSIAKRDHVLYVGRGVSYPIALEGALKLKEISYIHAEGYAAGELKHGPIALIDETVPVVVVAPSDRHFEKTVSNMHEIAARGGPALLISDKAGVAKAGEVWRSIQTPPTNEFNSAIVNAVPVQLLAYYTATAKGTDVDQPRNLAKSVTVE